MFQRVHSFFSPPHPVPRASLYASSVFIASLGRGVWVPFALLYFHVTVGLPLPLVGLGLTIGGLWAMAITPLAGTLVDRFGPRTPLVFGQIGAGLCMLAFLLVHSFAGFLLVSLLFSSAQAIQDPAFNALVADLFPEEDRDWWFGFNRSASNLGIGMGGLLAGGAVSLGGVGMYQVLLIANALSSIVTALLLLGIPLPVHAHRPAPAVDRQSTEEHGGYIAVLRDRPFLGFVIMQGILTLSYMALEIAMPPYVLSNLHAPAWGFSMLYTINTAMVVVLQMPLMRLLMKHKRTSGILAGGLVFAGSFLLFLAALALPGWLLIPYLALVMVIYTMGELLLSPSQVSLSMALAPEELRGRYMAISSLSYGISGTLAPVLFTSLLTLSPLLFWLSLTVLIAGTSCLVPALERHLPANTLRALPQEEAVEILAEAERKHEGTGELIGSRL